MPNYELARYFHSKTALREGMMSIIGKSYEDGMAFRETGLRFLLADPMAEATRAFRQEFLSREPGNN